MNEMSLSLLLARLAEEVRTQELAVRDLHDLAVAAGPEGAARAQGIDIASQNLAEIAALLGRLGEAADASATVPPALVEPVALAALRDRLLGGRSEGGEAGEVDFF